MDNEAEEIPANERRIRPGGLYRCCTETYANSTKPSRVGTLLDCDFCQNGSMIVAKDGVWERNE